MFPRQLYHLFYFYDGIRRIYWTHKALKKGDYEETKKWLIHWILITIYFNVMYVADLVLGLWLPFYNEMTFLIFLWLFSSNLNGSQILYREYLNPWISKYEDTIDVQLQQDVNELLKRGVKLTSDTLKDIAKVSVKLSRDSDMIALQPEPCAKVEAFENSIKVGLLNEIKPCPEEEDGNEKVKGIIMVDESENVKEVVFNLNICDLSNHFEEDHKLSSHEQSHTSLRSSETKALLKKTKDKKKRR